MKKNVIKNLFQRLTVTRRRKIIFYSSVAVVGLLAVILALPATRYFLFSQFVKKDISFVLTDSQTNKPVSDVTVMIGNLSASSKADGTAVLHNVPVGNHTVTFQKTYFKSSTATVTTPIFNRPETVRHAMTATGRQVTFMVADAITGIRIAGARLTVDKTSAVTDKTGQATIVVAPGSGDRKGSITKDGYNASDVSLSVESQSANAYKVSPAGSIVFLNNGDGKINVVRANLDGSGVSTIVAGTGNEDKYTTSLLSSRDWKYSVLKASRDDDKEKLYIVDTAKSTFVDFDEGALNFNLIGWAGHSFFYTVQRDKKDNDKRAALKSYDAETGKLSTLDETSGSGTEYFDAQYEFYSQAAIIGDELVVAKIWSASSYILQDKSATLYSFSTKTGKRTSIKDYSQANNGSLDVALYEPQGVYIKYQQSGSTKPEYEEYEDREIKSVTLSNADDFYDYPTYLLSPSGNKTFWRELRNGKNTLFIGDAEGKSARQVSDLSEYKPYGWYGSDDQYILFTKNSSELYIASATGLLPATPLKITDYYKVQQYNGYGAGYGGQ